MKIAPLIATITISMFLAFINMEIFSFISSPLLGLILALGATFLPTLLVWAYLRPTASNL